MAGRGISVQVGAGRQGEQRAPPGYQRSCACNQVDGDGERHGAANITILTYAGDRSWSCEEDVYNPMTFLRAVKRWCRVAEAHDTLPPAGAEWLATYAR